MAFASGGRKGVKSDINVTPLVDVVLVLLIIFMVVTPMLERGQKVKLPKTHTSDDDKKPESFIISLPADHSVWLDEAKVSADTLGPALAAAMEKHPDRKVLVKGDLSLKVKDLRPVLLAADAAGARGISLAVEEVKQ
ncbi:MAG TPA: biopolymer transporter ExbD [Polyangiales bacterium]|nr:biopolymer transporter ExbD [Polyangiales bacterium]